MKTLSLWILPWIVLSCGLPHKPRWEGRTNTETPPPEAAADIPREADALPEAEEKEVMDSLNQTMKERYRSARGVDLRGGREMLAPGLETATLRSYTSLIDRLSMAFGRPVADIPLNDPSTFTISRTLQNDSPNYGVSGYRLLANTVNTLGKGLIAAKPTAFNQPPSAASASAQCQQWGERFWLRAMKEAEQQICVNAALEVTKATVNAAERWAQVCSVVATAPQLLIVDAVQTSTVVPGAPPAQAPAASAIVGDANTGRQLFNSSCVGCHGGNRPIRARTDGQLQAAAANMNHIGREIYMVPPQQPTVATEYHHILAFLKSLGT